MSIGCNLIAFCRCSDKLEVLAVSLVLDESRCLVTHRISRRSRGLSNMEAEMSGRVYLARQHAIQFCIFYIITISAGLSAEEHSSASDATAIE